MSTIVTRAGKGSPLTWNEADNNFTNLNTDKLQSGNTAAALTITSATISGGALNGSLGATTPSTAVVTSLTDSGLTSGRVTFASTGGLLADSANFVFTGTNMGLGTASPTARLMVEHGRNTSAIVGYTLTDGFNSSINMQAGYGNAAASMLYTGTGEALLLGTANTERARITHSGYLKASNTGSYLSSTGAYHEFSSSGNGSDAVAIVNTSAGPYGLYVAFTGSAPNNTTNYYINGGDTSATRFVLRSNGGLANYSANNVNLSDVRTKTDIQDAGSYLAKICAIPVRTFKYKDQTDDELNLGVIAQEVEAVAPELVDLSGFGETPEDGVPLKAIYQTDLQYALMKCIQELKAELDITKAKVAALEAA